LSGLTKVFIVLQLVFSLVVSVLLVLMVAKLEPYKAQVDAAHTGRIAAQAQLAAIQQQLTAAEGALTRARSDLETAVSSGNTALMSAQARNAGLTQQVQDASVKASQAQTQITSLTNAIATLKDLLSEKDKQLGELAPRVAQLTTQYNEVYRSNNELQNQLRGAELTIRKLQEQIVQMPTGGTTAPGTGAAPADSGAQVTSLSAANAQAARGPINAQVTDINTSAGRTIVEVPLGTRDGVKNGNRFFIYRNNNYLGEAVITTVTPGASVLTVQGTPREPIQKGDMVMSAQ
jgi:hypothetical protein